jgi:exosortase/archaeosortase family protein
MPNSSILTAPERTAGWHFLEGVNRGMIRLRREPAITVFALSFIVICLDYILAPGLNAFTPVLSYGLLVVLLLRGSPHAESGQPPASLGGWRVLFFLLLHLILVAGFLVWQGVNTPVRNEAALPAPAATLAKYLVLLPTIVLLPMAAWRNLNRLYRAEFVAAAIALLSFFPHRLFLMAWPWYSQILGRVVHELSRPFVAGLQYVPFPSPTLMGPHLDVTILFLCSGLQAIKLFQLLFGLILIVDWAFLNRRRTLAAYFGGLGFMLLANVLRIALLFVIGNHVAAGPVVEYHVTGGWIFFTVAFCLYLLVTYRWILGQGKNRLAPYCDRAKS